MSRRPGDRIAVVVKSHRWYWRPRFMWGGCVHMASVHWLGFFAAWERKESWPHDAADPE